MTSDEGLPLVSLADKKLEPRLAGRAVKDTTIVMRTADSIRVTSVTLQTLFRRSPSARKTAH